MKTVKDVMLPLDDVPTVPPEATLADAVRALREADENRPTDRPPYRAVLVVDGRGQGLSGKPVLGYVRVESLGVQEVRVASHRHDDGHAPAPRCAPTIASRVPHRAAYFARNLRSTNSR